MIAQVKALHTDTVTAHTGEAEWKDLFKITSWAAVLSLVFFPIQIAAFMIRPYPEAVTGWFQLLRESPLLGLIDLDLLLVVDQVLGVLIFLALFIALRKASRSLMIIGLAIGLISVILFIASNPAFGMLSLSKQYFAAATEAERISVLGAGQAMMATWQGSGFQASYLLGSVALIIISAVMLRSDLFSKATGYLGIVANVVALGLYIPVIGIYISVFSVIILWVWYLLVARGLFRLAKGNSGGMQ
jgi:hypothetical protein